MMTVGLGQVSILCAEDATFTAWDFATVMELRSVYKYTPCGTQRRGHITPPFELERPNDNWNTLEEQSKATGCLPYGRYPHLPSVYSGGINHALRKHRTMW